MCKTTLHITILLLTVLLLFSCRRHRPFEEDELRSDTTYQIEEIQDSLSYIEQYDGLEIPSMKADSIAGQILKRVAYTACYNPNTLAPNWVAWVLTAESASGEVEKKIWYDDNGNARGIANFSPDMIKGTYIMDAEAESPSPQFTDWDLMPDNMSHGHMCPAADCQTSPEAITQSYLLTNICVQARYLNSGSWNRLEMKCRDLAQKYGRIFIVAGPVFNNGKIISRMGNIAIPDAFFKVLLCIERTPKAIGFVYANTNDSHNMEESVFPVDEIEKLTGLDFFSQLPDSIENEIESKANLNEWQ